MKKLNTASALFKKLVQAKGQRQARALLESLLKDVEGETLTIVANKSLHVIPKRFLRGHIHIASRGTLDLSSARAAESTYAVILKRLAKVLVAKEWKRIYLVPTGHPTLAAAIKLAVYQILRRNTTDVFYANGVYFDLNISIREDVKL